MCQIVRHRCAYLLMRFDVDENWLNQVSFLQRLRLAQHFDTIKLYFIVTTVTDKSRQIIWYRPK